MSQAEIPFLFVWGGTSRGPYFNRADLPENRDALTEVGLAVIGAGHPQNIDGIGGGVTVTTKVAMLLASQDPDCDVDYFFAQVAVEERLVDDKPTCGNILVGAGPAAIEIGLVKAVNTGATVKAIVETPGGQVRYEGDIAIAGIPGTAAPVVLSFLDVGGSFCGAFLPTRHLREEIDGIDVTRMDVAMPMMIARAEDFGLTGYETAEELDANHAFYDRMGLMRLEAGRRMGQRDVPKSVMPRAGLLSSTRNGGAILARCFMPWTCHPSMAVTGSQCLAACTLTPGTVAEGLGVIPDEVPALMQIEHPQGIIEVLVDYTQGSDGFQMTSVGLVRTARRLARGVVMVPAGLMKKTA